MFTTWVVGNFVRCTFEVLLIMPNGNLVTDYVDFDCRLMYYERADVSELPHWVMDCSESQANKWLNLYMPVRQVLEYTGDKNECR
jgi:hypothetical protein